MSITSGSMMTVWQHLACGVMLAVLAAWSYAPVRDAGFVYEDAQTLRAISRGPPHLIGARSLTNATWWLQAHTTASAGPFHVANVAAHFIAVALVGLLLRRVGVSPAAMWFGMALFALHRIQVEAVAYVSGRGDLLGTIWILSACVVAAGEWWTIASLAGIAAAMVCVWLTKEAVLVVLLLVPLIVWYRQTWRLAGPMTQRFVIGMGLVVLGCLALRIPDGGMWWRQGEAPGAVTDGMTWALAQATAAVRLLLVALWLVAPTVDADIDIVPMIWRIISACVLVALGWQAWHLCHRQRLIAVGLAWTLICVAPRLLIRTPRSYLNAHQFYAAMVGVVVLAAAIWDATTLVGRHDDG